MALFIARRFGNSKLTSNIVLNQNLSLLEQSIFCYNFRIKNSIHDQKVKTPSSYVSKDKTYNKSPSSYVSKDNTYNKPPSSYVSKDNTYNKPNRSTFKNRKPFIKIDSTEKNTPSLVDVNDPDSFGLLCRTNHVFTEKYEHDEDDQKEEEFIGQLPLHKQQLHMQKYIDLIKENIANKKLKEAIDVLEIRMLKEDRVKPESFIYNLLIGGCAEVGYTKKAFQLFNDMKKRGLNVSGGVYTSLFNACANSPWKEDGVTRAKHLRELMFEKQIEPNLTIYNSMIKAFGRCEDIKTAFEIVDEMCEKKIKLRVHTFNFLLQSCISDKETGFRFALFTWRKMLMRREKPNIYTFNLMLKCIKECGFGVNSDEVMKHILSLKPPQKLKANSSILLLDRKKPAILEKNQQLIESRIEIDRISLEENAKKNDLISVVDKPSENAVTIPVKIPNFLSPSPEMNDVVSFAEIITPKDRFVMVGGIDGIFEEMKANNVKPDIKTVTQLLNLIPSTLEAEEALLKALKEYKIKTDIDFYNMLIKKRCYRFDYKSAKNVMQLVDKENSIIKKKPFIMHKSKQILIKPNIMTYGILALTCKNKDNAREFINEIKNKRLRINAEIMGTLLRAAMKTYDVEYITYIIETTKSEMVRVNELFFSHLNKFETKCLEILRKQKEDERPSDDKIESCKLFLKMNKKWSQQLGHLKREEPNHPWEQFRVTQPETFQRKNDSKKKRYYKTKPRRVPKYVVKG